MSIRARRAVHPSITFRSLLEARYSVILDELEIQWQFEPTEFDLPSGVYRPDFQCHSQIGEEFWIEIKGPWPNAREFEVATEINLYVAPLMILSGDIPRQANGGTAWYFSSDRQWHMLRAEEAFRRIMWPAEGERPEVLAGWEQALDAARHEELIKEAS